MHKLPELGTVGNKIPNRQAICDALMEAASADRSVVALCSDSRGSASMTPFFNAYPEQSIEVGIAEQNLVSISAGLAKCGKKPYAFSPACFLSTRSYEQAKIDCAYSDTNVKLIGISGGVSYGALGMSHHSAQDIAALSAIPNMRVYLPSDRHQTKKLIQALLADQKCAYVRVGRNPVEDIHHGFGPQRLPHGFAGVHQRPSQPRPHPLRNTRRCSRRQARSNLRAEKREQGHQHREPEPVAPLLLGVCGR